MRVLISVILFIILNSSYSLAEPLPRPWAHHNQENYEAGVTTNNPFTGKYSAYIRSREVERNTIGTLWQAIKPRPDWFGERVRMTVYMKTLRVKNAAGLFMRVSTYAGWINYDYMYDRVVRGDTDWHQQMIVLDIPRDTSIIDFGVWIIGKGEVQIDDFRFGVVDNKLDITGTSEKIEFGQPRNLDFEVYTEVEKDGN
jgi:serine/threonine-protein kinase